MQPEATAIVWDPITTFCQAVQAKHAASWPPSEEILAEEFINHFNLRFAGFAGLQSLCERLRIEFSKTALPESLRGYNLRYQDKRAIMIAEKLAFIGCDEHTLLHEIREQLEYDFVMIGGSICSSIDKEERADDFAIAVRLKMFQKELPAWFDHAATIEKKWPRRATYVLLFLVACGYAAGVMLLPNLEDVGDPISIHPCRERMRRFRSR